VDEHSEPGNTGLEFVLSKVARSRTSVDLGEACSDEEVSGSMKEWLEQLERTKRGGAA